jgi:hypothetical protein
MIHKQSVLGVSYKQVGQKVLRVVGYLCRKVELGLHDFLEHCLSVGLNKVGLNKV